MSVYKVLNGCKSDNGCQTQLHGTSYIYSINPNKEQKILDRIISHQLIILDNPQATNIEKIDLTHGVTVEECRQKAEVQIVRPSSLNYKISLLEAALAFQSKDKSKDQVIDIELEEPTNKQQLNYDVLDDALYLVTKVVVT